MYFPAASADNICLQSFLMFTLSTAGDLIESTMKRAAGVKDSGVVFPGHGGALDRMDSMILVAPVYFFMYVWGG